MILSTLNTHQWSAHHQGGKLAGEKIFHNLFVFSEDFFPRTCSRIGSNSSEKRSYTRRCSRAKDESVEILKKLHSTQKVEMQRHFSLRQSSIKTHGESGVDTCKKSKRCSAGIGSNCRNDSRLLARFLSCHSALDFAFAATTNDGDLDLTV